MDLDRRLSTLNLDHAIPSTSFPPPPAAQPSNNPGLPVNQLDHSAPSQGPTTPNYVPTPSTSTSLPPSFALQFQAFPQPVFERGDDEGMLTETESEREEGTTGGEADDESEDDVEDLPPLEEEEARFALGIDFNNLPALPNDVPSPAVFSADDFDKTESIEEEVSEEEDSKDPDYAEQSRKRKRRTQGRSNKRLKKEAKAQQARVTRPLVLPSHEALRFYVAQAISSKNKIKLETAQGEVGCYVSCKYHWSKSKRREEDVKVKAKHDDLTEKLRTQMKKEILDKLRKLRPQCFDAEGNLKVELRKPLDDILLSLSSNWPPVECLKDGIPIEAGKGLSMTERYLRNKGLLGDAVAFTDACIFYLSNEWTGKSPINDLFTKEGQETMLKQHANSLAPIVEQGIPHVAFGQDEHEIILKLDQRGLVKLNPLPLKVPVTYDDHSVHTVNVPMYETSTPRRTEEATGAPTKNLIMFAPQLCTFGSFATSMDTRTLMDVIFKTLFALAPSAVELPPLASELLFVNSPTYLLDTKSGPAFFKFISKNDRLQREAGRRFSDEELEKIHLAYSFGLTRYAHLHSVELAAPEVTAYSFRSWPNITEEVRSSPLHRVQVLWRMKSKVTLLKNKVKNAEAKVEREEARGFTQGELAKETRLKNKLANETEEEKLQREKKEAEEKRREGMSPSEKNMDTIRRNETEETKIKREEKEAENKRRELMTLGEKMRDTISKNAKSGGPSKAEVFRSQAGERYEKSMKAIMKHCKTNLEKLGQPGKRRSLLRYVGYDVEQSFVDGLLLDIAHGRKNGIPPA